MRLLKTGRTGQLSVEDYFSDKAPAAYTILSHTWGTDEDEVTYDDINKSLGLRKRGYRKIQFCAEQTTRDGFQYFWVDSCCINKACETELTQSIRAMFRWYEAAAICYVYLSDVSYGRNQSIDLKNSWETSFRRSRWFQRGWTLQELLAPATVKFFSQEGQYLGDKRSLVKSIHDITKIPCAAINGEAPLRHYTIQERMSWASGRDTKRKEDKAYCLQGIFEVNMSPRYEEGETSALQRLKKKIHDRYGLLPTSAWDFAPHSKVHDWILQTFHTSNYEGAMLTHPRPAVATCEWFFYDEEFRHWYNDPDRCWLWYTADPGLGKSVLCREVAERNLTIPGKTILYFFFDETNAWHSTMECALQAFLHQLFKVQPHLLDAVADYLGQYGVAALRYLDSMWQLLKDCLTRSNLVDVLCVVDGLDQCRNLDLPKFVEYMTLLTSASQQSGKKFHIFISARNYAKYTSTIRGLVRQGPHNWIRADSKLENIMEDVKLYVGERVTRIVNCHELTNEEARTLNFHMTARRDANFLCASLILNELDEYPLLSVGTMITALEDIPKDLEAYYTRALNQCRDAILATRVLAAVVCARRPLTLLEVGFIHDPKYVTEDMEPHLLGRLADRIRQTCGLLVRFHDGRIHLIHNSLRKFLLNTKDVASTPAARKFQECLPWKRSISKAEGERMLAYACIKSLTAPSIQLKSWAVLRPYAVDNWARHVVATIRQTKYKNPKTDIQKMIGLGLDPQMLDSVGKSLLHHAVDHYVHEVDMNFVLLLLHHGGLVRSADRENMTCLHYAAYRNNCLLIKILLEAGFNVDEIVTANSCVAAANNANAVRSIGKGLTALHAAAYFCSLEAVRMLLEAGADALACDEFGRTPLHLAVSFAFSTTAIPFDRWCDSVYMMGQIDNWGDEVAVNEMLERARRTRPAVLDSLCERSLMASSHGDFEGKTTLHRVRYDSLNSTDQTVSFVRRNGHNALAQDYKRRTPIHFAARAGDIFSLRRLVYHAGGLAMQDTNGCNALHVAARSNQLSVVQFVLENMKDFGHHVSLDNNGGNALHHALDGKSAYYKRIKVVQELIGAGIDPTHKDREGRDSLAQYLTGPLWRPPDPDIIQTLIDAGADVNYRGRKSETLAHLFVQCDSKFKLDGFLRLEAAGVQIRTLDAQGQTVLHHAAVSGSLNATLLNHFTQCMHMDVDQPDLAGKNALDYVIERAAQGDRPWRPERDHETDFERHRKGLGGVCQCQRKTRQ